ncbi:ferritin-like domain-containing protein [Hymenobacter antarcticus]|uniref:Ferritin-like domain-containing protein n=1 Tax=Hymenobacter antarcticus TaxID=486270 RepID=A0ABP7PQD7_9BACT
MNLSNLFNEIESVDPEIYDRMDARRGVINRFARVGTRLATAAVPVALGGLFNKAYGQKVSSDVLEVLNFALTLEHLESRFYQTAVGTPGLLPAKDKINVIRDHEVQHVKFLQQTITSAGGTPVAEGKYDFTGKGTFPAVFSDYKQFLQVAQAFEDTGVGAYKGQASELKSSNDILTAALRIHSMEARHAAHIRFIRMVNGYAKIKPWIVGDDNSKGTPFERIYQRESDHRQVVINIEGIGGYNVGNAATSSFDEPLHKDEVMAIVKPFLA